MHSTARTCLQVLTLVLVSFGIIMLYSTSATSHHEAYLYRQCVWAAAGGLGACVLWWLDYRVLGRYALLPLAMIALALAYLGGVFIAYRLDILTEDTLKLLPLISGPTKGSFRWLRLGKFGLQPSEFAKPFLVLFLADYYARHMRHTHELVRGFLQPMGVAMAILGLIFLGKDLSTTVITASVIIAVAFIAGVRLRYLVPLGLAGLLFVSLALYLSPERMRRLQSFRTPEELQRTDGYQLWHSQLALGSGGAFGRGFTDSRMKEDYLPEAHTDFIVAIVGEELGFVAVAGLVLTYCCFTGIAFWIAALAADHQGVLLAIGIGLLVGIQAFINISVVSGFCPTTGVTAPFLSYGGSSMLSMFVGVGLLLSVLRIGRREAAAEMTRTRFRTNAH